MKQKISNVFSKREILIFLDTAVLLLNLSALFFFYILSKECINFNYYIKLERMHSWTVAIPAVTLIFAFLIILLYVLQIKIFRWRNYLVMINIQVILSYLMYVILAVLFEIVPFITCA